MLKMKYGLIFLLTLLNVKFVSATEQIADSIDCDVVYSYTDSLVVLPEYEGGYRSFLMFCQQILKPAPIMNGMRPAKARVMLEFGVDKQGGTFNPKVMKIGRIPYDEFDKSAQEIDKYWDENIDLDYCKNEAFRILNFVKYIPAKREGINVCYEKYRTFIDIYYSANGYD